MAAGDSLIPRGPFDEFAHFAHHVAWVRDTDSLLTIACAGGRRARRSLRLCRNHVKKLRGAILRAESADEYAEPAYYARQRWVDAGS